VVAVVAASVVLSFGAGSAFAGGTVNCAPYGSDTVATVNADAGSGTVAINGTCTGQVVIGAGVTVTLQSGVHPGILDGGATGSAVSIGSGSTVTVQNLTIRNGSSAFVGGGVDMACCSSTLNLSNAVVTGNSAVSAGGGVYVDSGTVNAVSSQVSGNSSPFGAGIEAEVGATVNLTDSTVSGNSNGVGGAGGGIALDSSTGTLIGSTVSNNQAAYEGGGLLVTNFSVLHATASTIIGNQVTQVLNIYGGGGLWMANSQVSLDSTRVTGNISADYGGGIAYYGHTQIAGGLTVTNSTIDHNRAAFSGGGIYAKAEFGDAKVSLDHSTVSFNKVIDGDGGGVSNYGACFKTASLLATNSAFGGNLATSGEGGVIYNSNGVDGCADNGTALVTLSKTSVGRIQHTLNPDRALYGGGIFSENGDGSSNVMLLPGTAVAGNQALVNGGGVFNCGGSALTVVPGALIFLNQPNNLVNTLLCPP
jgi:predicted outer membrane repeat protein